ncbi:helix-turn-helix domain-containing protein [Catenuloplanes atrovinosus]|uniref:Transcriptional regulator with XRE-family HTH domain n=1 Tax=Catenuloplanes atrovinosus TaxID=137266 RepID=A0AAE3YYU7_9ACTN|nr:helix-turn-helix transcriptional regulator [Catenuloplanes atrovinosus]MDR7280878.1 transcriptional regulator with XRE-family HTH domain [Catenuloplanes atrovinosus]
MAPAPSPIVRRRRLGQALRRLRETAGLTGDQVIERIGWASASKLSRLENGRSRPDLGDVLDLLDLYGVSGPSRDELIAITRDAGNTRAWLRAYPVMTPQQRDWAELEAGCVDIREYAPCHIPGLLQTPEYARLRLVSARPLANPGVDGQNPEALENQIHARIARQALLTRRLDAPRYDAVLEDTALTGRAGPPEILRGQAAHLRRIGSLPNVTIRILPNSATIANWYLVHTSFSMYRFADPQDPETVAVETLERDMFVNEPHEVRHYATVYDWLRDAALSPEDSMDWLTEAAETLHTAARPPGQRRPSEI